MRLYFRFNVSYLAFFSEKVSLEKVNLESTNIVRQTSLNHCEKFDVLTPASRTDSRNPLQTLPSG